MNQIKTKPSASNAFLILGAVLTAIIAADIIMMFLIGNVFKSIKLYKSEFQVLNHDKNIITESSAIKAEFTDEISVISGVFPSEETLPDFIRILEAQLRSSTDEYTLKFGSLSPITEGDRLFMLLSLSLKTDYTRLMTFMENLEKLPFMTHITAVSVKTAGGFTGKTDVSLGLKIYVQKPFANQ